MTAKRPHREGGGGAGEADRRLEALAGGRGNWAELPAAGCGQDLPEFGREPQEDPAAVLATLRTIWLRLPLPLPQS